MSVQTKKSGQRAVVIGASMGGLLAGGALANHFDEVTLLERDSFPVPGLNRKGVPQGRHTHVLLERGRSIMEEYHPGLTDQLIEAGAVRFADVSQDVRWFRDGAYHQPGVSGVPGIGVSRPTLESLLCERVQALPNVTILEQCNVLEPVTTDDRRRVTGVRLIRRKDGGSEETMHADLVVDTSGRGSRSPSWLEAMGYARPDLEEVKMDMGYVTCHYPRQPDQFPGLGGIVILATPPDKRLATLLAQEKGSWILTVGGYLGEHPPADYDGFLQAVRELPTLDIYNVVKDVKPLDGPVAHGLPSNLRHRYERMRRFPHGYLVFGDALCSFNPIYAQGMTVGALEAVALDESLEAGVDGASKRFFPNAAKIIDAAWNTAVGSDLAYAEIEGARSPMQRFLNWYMDKLQVAAHSDAEVSIAFLRVINMVDPPQSILRPGIVWRVIKENLRQPSQHARRPATQVGDRT